MKKFDIVTLNISSSLKFNEINLSPSWAKGGGEQHKNICCYFHSSTKYIVVLSPVLYFPFYSFFLEPIQSNKNQSN